MKMENQNWIRALVLNDKSRRKEEKNQNKQKKLYIFALKALSWSCPTHVRNIYECVNISTVFFIIVRVRQLTWLGNTQYSSVKCVAVAYHKSLRNIDDIFENGAEWTSQDVLHTE